MPRRAGADRVEIEALRGEFTDVVMMRDYDRFASLFTHDGAWRIPYANVELVSRQEIRAGIERAQDLLWEYSVYHDRYQRTPDGWKFTERVYEIRYLDTTRWRARRPTQQRAPANPPAENKSPTQGSRRPWLHRFLVHLEQRHRRVVLGDRKQHS